ncbi:MAG: DsbA family oxidoreductase, partial [Pseudorhodobacter sp.]|nr:DsbA family oxidoreductase [Pseudorhodobacter sp.]
MTTLDIFSDPVCPWCYLGKANLDRALEQHPEHPFIIEWHPFQLNPDMPPEGVDKRSYLLERFGSQQQLDTIHQRFRDIARRNGVQMDPDTPKRIPNTLNAHRVIHWAGLEGRQSFAVAALMRAYWVEGRDIGNLAVLADIAAGIGMNRAVVERLLASDADLDTVTSREAHARKRGVNA